jgi:hypothetical protein
MMKGRSFDFDIFSIPSTFVIRTSSFPEGKIHGIALPSAKST